MNNAFWNIKVEYILVVSPLNEGLLRLYMLRNMTVLLK